MTSDKQDIDKIHERAFADLLCSAPDTASYFGVSSVNGIKIPNDTFTDYSHQGVSQRAELMRRLLAEIQAIPRCDQTDEQKLTTDVFAYFLEYANLGPLIGLRGRAFAYHNYPLNQLTGLQSELPTLMVDYQPVLDRRSAEDYIVKLSKLPDVLELILESVETRERLGIIPPRFIIPQVIDEMRDLVDLDARQNPLYSSFKNKMALLEDISDGRKESLLVEVENLINGAIYPVYEKLIAFLSDQAGRASDDAGVWKFSDGDAYYDFVLQSETTTDMSAGDIHELGLQEIERLHRDIRQAFSELGYRGRSIAELFVTLSCEKRFCYSDTPESRPILVKDYEQALEDIEGKLDGIFDLRHKAPVIVKPIPTAFEANRSSSYTPPARDGSRPGLFNLNISQAMEKPKWETPVFAYHEAVPGHHLQFCVAQEIEGLATFRQTITFNAYIEGWAKYAETLPWEFGFNQDPFAALGRMRFELFSTTNLALDTGIHRKRWSRNKGIKFFMKSTGASEVFARHIVDRVIVYPGQACSYKIGMLKMIELRDKMKCALGDNFNIKSYHNTILKNGSLPLSILEKVVDQECALLKSQRGGLRS